MGRHEKLIVKILSGRQDTGVKFSELVNLLLSFGFSQRISGSHRIFYKEGVDEIINLQPEGAQAKPYQVKQVRNIMVKYRLEEKDE
ncbi:MAG: type II toxin-antitoxin system HicA family toxin [Candidatus Accumulibacter sp.]|nr:type II toxin-antitoxin system HicA family toxin [Accumulibacter sp.]